MNSKARPAISLHFFSGGSLTAISCWRLRHCFKRHFAPSSQTCCWSCSPFGLAIRRWVRNHRLQILSYSSCWPVDLLFWTRYWSVLIYRAASFSQSFDWTPFGGLTLVLPLLIWSQERHSNTDYLFFSKPDWPEWCSGLNCPRKIEQSSVALAILLGSKTLVVNWRYAWFPSAYEWMGSRYANPVKGSVKALHLHIRSDHHLTPCDCSASTVYCSAPFSSSIRRDDSLLLHSMASLWGSCRRRCEVYHSPKQRPSMTGQEADHRRRCSRLNCHFLRQARPPRSRPRFPWTWACSVVGSQSCRARLPTSPSRRTCERAPASCEWTVSWHYLAWSSNSSSDGPPVRLFLAVWAPPQDGFICQKTVIEVFHDQLLPGVDLAVMPTLQSLFRLPGTGWEICELTYAQNFSFCSRCCLWLKLF